MVLVSEGSAKKAWMIKGKFSPDDTGKIDIGRSVIPLKAMRSETDISAEYL